MSYRTIAGSCLLFFVGAHFALMLLTNLGIVELPRQYWLPWVLGIIVPAIVSEVALVLAIWFERLD